MKIYATVDNERTDTRPVKKGANEFLRISVSNGNKKYFQLEVNAGDGSIELHGANGYLKKFTPFDIGHK